MDLTVSSFDHIDDFYGTVHLSVTPVGRLSVVVDIYTLTPTEHRNSGRLTLVHSLGSVSVVSLVGWFGVLVLFIISKKIW